MTRASTTRWVLGVDGSLNANRAADYVARWARALGVVDVYVLNAQPLGSYRAYALRHNETLLELSEEGARATAVARKVLDDARVAYRVHTDVGEPADAIVAAVRSEHASEIVLGSRGLGAFANLALGSVAYKVIHLAEVPVTVVANPREEPHLLAAGPDGAHRVLMACDDSDHAMHAVDYVCRLHPASVSIDVLLVNVQLPILSGNVRRHVTKEMIDTYYREEGEQALRRAARALTKAGIAHESCVMAGHVAETLVQMAEQHRCTRIVMGTRGLGAVGNIVLGSVAYKVLHLASTPVTLVK